MRKLRYPIADHLLADEPPPDPPLADWPEPRHAINLPPELQSCVGGLLAAFDFVTTYGDALELAPISLEDLRAVLLHRGPTTLLTELFVSLMRLERYLRNTECTSLFSPKEAATNHLNSNLI